MGLTKENLDQATKLLIGLAQRHDTIYQLAQRLNSAAAWRSPDGKLTIDLTDDERKQLEEFVQQYLQDAEVLATTLKGHLGPGSSPKGQ